MLAVATPDELLGLIGGEDSDLNPAAVLVGIMLGAHRSSVTCREIARLELVAANPC